MSPKRGLSLDEIGHRNRGGRLNDEGTLQHSLPGVHGIRAVQTIVVTADQVRYHPHVVEYPLQIDQLIIEVTSAGAGSTTARLGLYHADNEFQPTALVVDAGTVAVDSTGKKAITLGTVELLSPGRYVTAFNSDGTPTIRTAQYNSGDWGGVTDDLGANHFVLALRATQTYAVFPDPGLAYTEAQIGNAGLAYGVYMRVSAL